jgi:hypothetical protein
MGVLPPDEVADLLSERVRQLEQQVRERRALVEDLMREQGLARVFLIEEEHRAVLEEAEAEWVRGLVRDIRKGTLDGIELWRSFHEGGGAPGGRPQT